MKRLSIPRPAIRRNRLLIGAWLFLCCSSCYSVRIASKEGVGEPDPTNQAAGFYRGLKVHDINTTVHLSLLENEPMLLTACPEGLYSVEYRVTVWHTILSGLILGKLRKVRVKYVCKKESN